MPSTAPYDGGDVCGGCRDPGEAPYSSSKTSPYDGGGGCCGEAKAASGGLGGEVAPGEETEGMPSAEE